MVNILGTKAGQVTDLEALAGGGGAQPPRQARQLLCVQVVRGRHAVQAAGQQQAGGDHIGGVEAEVALQPRDGLSRVRNSGACQGEEREGVLWARQQWEQGNRRETTGARQRECEATGV